MKEFQAAQGELSSALGRLLVTIERYPDLKANQNFLELQAQLEGTENRIQVARRQYNTVAGEFNKKVRVFPTNIIAGLFGITAKPFFEADEASSKAPKVVFVGCSDLDSLRLNTLYTFVISAFRAWLP